MSRYICLGTVGISKHSSIELVNWNFFVKISVLSMEMGIISENLE